MTETSTSESRWFKIIVLIISGFFVGFSVANIVYYAKIRNCTSNSNSNCSVSRGEATSMIIVNSILLIISFILFIWSIITLIVHPQARQQYQQRVVQYLQNPPTGLVSPSTTISTTTTTTPSTATLPVQPK